MSTPTPTNTTTPTVSPTRYVLRVGQLIYDGNIYNNNNISIYYKGYRFAGKLLSKSTTLYEPPNSTTIPRPTRSPTPTQTKTPTLTPSITKTQTPTVTPTKTPKATSTPTKTPTRTVTSTRTSTPTPSVTKTATPTNTVTKTPTRTATTTKTNTPTPTVTPTLTQNAPVNVTILLSGQSPVTISCPRDEYILNAAESNGISIPYLCRVGSCGTCMASTLSGSVNQSDQIYLDEDQIASGCIMTCVAYPLSDLSISVPGDCAFALPPTPTPTKTISLTPTQTTTLTSTPTRTPTPTLTQTITPTSTKTLTPTPTQTATQTPTNNNLNTINNVLGVGNTTNIIYSSNTSANEFDDITWSTTSVNFGASEISPASRTVTKGYVSSPYGRKFIIGTYGDNYAVSDDGINWTQRLFTNTSNYTGFYTLFHTIIFADCQSQLGSNIFMAIGHEADFGNGMSCYLSSTNLSSWSKVALPGSSSTAWIAGAYGNNVFMLIPGGSTTYYTSTNGTTWTSRILPYSSSNLMELRFINGHFIAIFKNNRNIIISNDGINWTVKPGPSTAGYRSVTYLPARGGNGSLYVFLHFGTSNYSHSDDDNLDSFGTFMLPFSGAQKIRTTLDEGLISSAIYEPAFVVSVNGSFIALSVLLSSWTFRSVTSANWNSITS